MSVLITAIGCAPASAIARSLSDYNIIGIDMKDSCIGEFICNTFVSVKEAFNTAEYWDKINQLIIVYNIKYVFVSLQLETVEWASRKTYFMQNYNCNVFLNDVHFCKIANNKEYTYSFCIENNINIPEKMNICDRPIVIKEIEGCGSMNMQIVKLQNENVLPFHNTKYMIQRFIEGDEYTVDVISDPNGSIVNIVPKKRCFIKNGQAFISKIVNDCDIIDFVKKICIKLNNKSAINVQVIREKHTNSLFLIEINPRFATTINLTIEAGVNIPKMLIENDFTSKLFENGLTMIRDYKEYFKRSEKRIFITGGAGFIGSNVVKILLSKTNHYITIYDNLSTVDCGIRNIEKYIDNNRVAFIEGDIMNKTQLFEYMNGHDIVIHLAAQLEITSAYNNPLYDLNINLIGTINVIEGCVHNKINRLINASSACVYGFTEGNASKETDQTNPNWEYGVSKLAAEKYIQIASDMHRLIYTSLRFSIVYGENEWFGRVLTIFAKRAIENKDLVIFGDGKQTRDYINVYDVANFILECINNKNTYNKNYNVSSGKATSIVDLAKYVQNLYPNISILYDTVKEGEISTLVEGRERLKNELTHLCLDNTKALNETNWKPSITFDNGIKQYFEWIKINKWTNKFKV